VCGLDDMAYLDVLIAEYTEEIHAERHRGKLNLRKATVGKASFERQQLYSFAAICVGSSVVSAIKLLLTSYNMHPCIAQAQPGIVICWHRKVYGFDDMAYLDFLTAEDAKQMHAKTAEESQQWKSCSRYFAISALNQSTLSYNMLPCIAKGHAGIVLWV
jgi:hypothetical protein